MTLQTPDVVVCVPDSGELVPVYIGGGVGPPGAPGTPGTPGAPGVGVTDGDKGDVVLSGGGTVWNVESATPADGSFDVSGSLIATGHCEFDGHGGWTNKFVDSASAPGGSVGLRGLSGYPEVHIRPAAGQKGVVSFTEDAVADRWSLGIKPADANLYFSAGDTGLFVTRATLGPTGLFSLIGVGAGVNFAARNSGNNFVVFADAGSLTFYANGAARASLTDTGKLSVADDPYSATWDGNLEVPTKNAVYDKIQTVSAGGGGTTTNALTINNSGTGVASGGTFNGSAAVTISFNSIGALPVNSPTVASGKLTTVASAAGGAGLILPHGAAPTSPANGDVWTTTGALLYRVNGATLTSAVLEGNTFTGKITTLASAAGGAGFNLPHGAAPTSPVNGDIWSTTAGLFGRINGVTLQNVFAGSVTVSGLTMNTARLLGRTTAAAGAVEEITAGATLSLTAGSLGVASVPNAATFNNAGTGAASGTTFNGSAAQTISWNTIGAAPDTPRVQSLTSSATITPTFANDLVKATAQAVNATLANPTGTAVDGWGWVIKIKAAAAGLTLGYGTQYRAMGVTLPTTLTNAKNLYLGCLWNADETKVDVIAVAQEA